MTTKVTPNEINIPYKFSVYRTSATTSSNTPAVVPMDTRTFDTGSNVDIVTNKGRFTAPVAGFYWFCGMAGNTAATSTQIATYLYKNGSVAKEGSSVDSALTSNLVSSTVSGLIQLAASDYVELYFIGGSGSTMGVGADKCYFDGMLISTS